MLTKRALLPGEADDEDDEDDEEDDMDESDDEEEDEEEDAGSDPPFPKQVEQAFRRMKEEGKGSAKFESVYSFSENRTEELQDKLALGACCRPISGAARAYHICASGTAPAVPDRHVRYSTSVSDRAVRYCASV
eukprot:1375729-Rhodomonas_salina.5